MAETYTTVHPCFWCEKLLSKQFLTKDHLLCRFIRKGQTNLVCLSCHSCNQKRNHISSIFKIISKNKLPKRWNRQIRKLLQKVDVLKFKNRIETIENKQIQNLCLMEIDIILLKAKELGVQ